MQEKLSQQNTICVLHKLKGGVYSCFWKLQIVFYTLGTWIMLEILLRLYQFQSSMNTIITFINILFYARIMLNFLILIICPDLLSSLTQFITHCRKGKV